MPILMTPLGTTLDVQIVDQNFITLQGVLKSGLTTTDFVSLFERVQIRHFTSGKLVRASTYSNPFYKEGNKNYQTPQTIQKFDLSYRPGNSPDSSMVEAFAAISADQRPHYAMELLGRPGPSLYYNFQEDDLPDASSFPAASWPPSNWPPDRYDDKYCYSRWLTVPGCSLKIDVPHEAVARITANAMGQLTLFGAMCYVHLGANPDYPHKEAVQIGRLYHAYRFGLIIDTNPIMDNEFTNSNRHIIDPTTGLQASHCSWKVLEDKTFYAAQREAFKLKSEVFLQGGKRYNLRLAYRDAATHGYVLEVAGNYFWYDGVWEGNALIPPAASLWPLAATKGHPFSPPWINFWDSAGLSVELDYGRSAAWAASLADPGLIKS